MVVVITPNSRSPRNWKNKVVFWCAENGIKILETSESKIIVRVDSNSEDIVSRFYEIVDIKSLL